MMKKSDNGIAKPCYDVIRVVKMVALGSNQWSITLFQEPATNSNFCCLPTYSLSVFLQTPIYTSDLDPLVAIDVT